MLNNLLEYVIDFFCAIIKYSNKYNKIHHDLAEVQRYAVASSTMKLSSTHCLVIKTNDPICF